MTVLAIDEYRVARILLAHLVKTGEVPPDTDCEVLSNCPKHTKTILWGEDLPKTAPVLRLITGGKA
jgi:hypothetical protein